MKKGLLFILFALNVACFSQLPVYVPTNGIIGYWPLDGNANDVSGNMLNGINNGAIPGTNRFGLSNAAYSFNGVSDYIEVANNGSFSGMSDLSISAWVNMNSFSGIQHIVSKWYQVTNCNNTNSDSYAAAFIQNQVHLATNNNPFAFSTPPTLTNSDLGSWKHLVFINSSITGQALYIDGVLSGTQNNPGAICPSINNLLFGASHNGGTLERFLNGKIDDIGMWSRVLTDCEIKKLYYGGNLQASVSQPTICLGSAVTLSASGAPSYTWTSSAPGATAQVSPSVTTIFTVNSNYGVPGCSNAATVQVTVKPCTSVDTYILMNQTAINLKVYPNPNQGLLYISLSEHLLSEGKVLVEDIFGTRVAELDLKEAQAMIHLGSLEDGLYLVRFVEGERTLKTEKLVLKK